ncbi:MAG: hypothetical protein A2600_05820 [Candidatus Lambdaproteobacteria bacterium RIFOXYD1_FULL_56_27]|uniref:Outer membrane protein beta-barrel domain-containing protein n=1 Tax=Candidatus Lambdaproteobacteria bacterium RIFOXYD2_FULL_56_26 TaxID=1817773 RepID=A0A1F6GRF9_9PROT|nr:MAG: hypothetical protein A2426_11025 [Candidatus Lambdaproteobacteria bacterium RIFOXYC1_FULL_56_13]OGH00715.1 MAG: hypothetical protein A2557_03525 [Candidatus Lambdaproteobacteria bacterium RIFOXYD2_FULL_56_26]OGH07882.1 MAG: hypothetical protein A2600_05820 [Candidatus Lambdaproteobacteria bacterium RIFOXYD1_FULL_56_27]
MLKRLLFTLVALSFTTSPLWAETTQSGNVILPVTDSSYKGHPVLSLVGGTLSPSAAGSESGSLVGVELSLDCPLFQASAGNVRQQISYTTYSKSNLSVSLIEINPHWMTELSPGFTAGFGPGLGLAQTSVTGGSSASYFEYGLGASASYKTGALVFGFELRNMTTGKKNNADMSNSRTLLKAGYAF